jgi:hypothetical protein
MIAQREDGRELRKEGWRRKRLHGWTLTPRIDNME